MMPRLLPFTMVGVYLCAGASAAQSQPQDSLIFRVRGQDHVVQNKMVQTLRSAWAAQKPATEQMWKDAVNNGGKKTWEGHVWIFIGIIPVPVPYSYTVQCSDTSVSIPDLPNITLSRGSATNTLEFQAAVTLNWTTHLRGSNGSVHADASFTTVIKVNGVAELKRDQTGYYLQITSATSDVATNTNGSITFTVNILNIGTLSFTWQKLDLLLKADIDKKVKKRLGDELGKPIVTKAYYLADLFAYLKPGVNPLVEALLFPIYSYLSERGKIAYSLLSEKGVPVVELVFGNPIAGAWQAEKTQHPRLLYTAAERSQIKAKRGANVTKDLYSAIKTLAAENPAFGVAGPDGLLSVEEWGKEVRNAQIAVAASVVYDLDANPAAKEQALTVLLNFRDKVPDPLFTPAWGFKSLYTAEVLLDLCQAYDLLRGAGVAANPAIEAKLRNLRNVTYLQTHIWNLIANLNIAVRNAAALGASAILFNREADAYENISLAMSVMWQKLGLASAGAFLDVAQFTKASEGGGYSEGPGYLDYAAELYLPFMWSYNRFAGGATTSPGAFIYNDWVNQYAIAAPDLLTSERVRRIHEWGLRISLPDGSRPPLKDSNPGASGFSGLLANAIATPNPILRSVWAWDFERSGYPVGRRLVDAFVSFDPAVLNTAMDPSSLYPSPTMVMPDTGNVVFRSGWGVNSLYMHVLADSNWRAGDVVGGMRYPTHQQEDNTSFLIHAYGSPLAIDSGYGHSSVSEAVSKGQNHNLVLVDGKGPPSATEAAVRAFKETRFVDYAQVSAAYQNAAFERHALLVGDRYFVVVDEISSSISHQYDWRFHGHGQFSAAEKGGMWAAPGGQRILLRLANTSPNSVDAFLTEQAPHYWASPGAPGQPGYHHTALSGRETAAGNIKFLAVLLPAGAADPLPSVAEFSEAGAFTAAKIAFADHTDIVVVRHPGRTRSYTLRGSATGVDDIYTDAQFAVLRISNSNKKMAGLFAREVSDLFYGGARVVTTPTSLVSVLDSDTDGLSDDDELARGTDPFKWDTDGDGLSDSLEVANGSNPLVRNVTSDWDGDGRADLGFFEPADSSFHVNLSTGTAFFGPGTGRWIDPNQWGHAFGRFFVADFNGDGKADLGFFEPADNSFHVNLSTGNGLFGAGSGRWINPNQWGHAGGRFYIGDFNGDGRSDLGFFEPADNSFHVNLSTGAGFFGPGSGRWITGNTWGNAGGRFYVGDFNGDGKTDLGFLEPADNSFRVNLSTGAGFFGPESGRWIGSNQWAHAGGRHMVADFNGDRKADLGFFEPADNSFHVNLSTGTGFFAAGSGRWVPPGGFGSSAGRYFVADFTGDGLSDLAFYNVQDNLLKVIRSAGTRFISAFGFRIEPNHWGRQAGRFLIGNPTTDAEFGYPVFQEQASWKDDFDRWGWHPTQPDGPNLSRNFAVSLSSSAGTAYLGSVSAKLEIPHNGFRASGAWHALLPDSTGARNFVFAFRKTNPSSALLVYFVVNGYLHQVWEKGHIQHYQGWEIPFANDTEWHLVTLSLDPAAKLPSTIVDERTGTLEPLVSAEGQLTFFELGMGGQAGDRIYFDSIRFME
ncbi:MAG: VCBS repeat-containing protein [Bryobacteraceae bacterium]|nr:VCBS repeat-containing protein [Bryobacteraceae bacterium]